MILESLLDAMKVPPTEDIPKQCGKPVQTGDIVLGKLSGLALNVSCYLRGLGKEIQEAKANAYDMRSKAIRNHSVENASHARDAVDKLLELANRYEIINRLFRLELAEEFRIEREMCVGVRDDVSGVVVVKYGGPPADNNKTIFDEVLEN